MDAAKRPLREFFIDFAPQHGVSNLRYHWDGKRGHVFGKCVQMLPNMLEKNRAGHAPGASKIDAHGGFPETLLHMYFSFSCASALL